MSSSPLLLLLLLLKTSVKDPACINIRCNKISYIYIPLAIILLFLFTFYISKSLFIVGALIGTEFRLICWLLLTVLSCLGTFLQSGLLLCFLFVGFRI
jgi:hypothetical protein